MALHLKVKRIVTNPMEFLHTRRFNNTTSGGLYSNIVERRELWGSCETMLLAFLCEARLSYAKHSPRAIFSELEVCCSDMGSLRTRKLSTSVADP